MKMFPKFGARHVRIQGGDGKIWTVPKLGIKHIDTYRDILDGVQEKINSAPKDQMIEIEAMIDGRTKLVALVSEVLPECLVEGDLKRFNYDEMCDLAGYLIYGDDGPDQEAAPNEKKTETSIPENS